MFLPISSKTKFNTTLTFNGRDSEEVRSSLTQGNIRKLRIAFSTTTILVVQEKQAGQRKGIDGDSSNETFSACCTRIILVVTRLELLKGAPTG